MTTPLPEARKATQVEFRPNGVVEVMFADGLSSSYILEDYQHYVSEGSILVDHLPDSAFVDNCVVPADNGINVSLEQKHAQTVTNPVQNGHSRARLSIWDIFLISGLTLMGASFGLFGAVLGAVIGYMITLVW